MTILEELADHTRKRIAGQKEIVSQEELREQAYAMPKGDFSFEKALKRPGLSFICECKKASPSKGVIAEEYPYLDIAVDYEAAGADCISVLTEPDRFMGSDEHAKNIAGRVDIPILRKDFTIDAYMIYQAKVMGAGAVLLIVSLLDDKTLSEYLGICDELGLSALVETHDGEEIKRALSAGARIIGVNNRNLKDFSVDTSLALRMRELIPEDVVFVSESGVSSEEDVYSIRRSGADAVLIGEMLMRSHDRKALLGRLKSGSPQIKLCGLSTEKDIECANSLGVDYVGFVFAKKSKRYISKERAAELKSHLSKKIKAVGVFFDSDISETVSFLESGIIDMAQLHGNEDEAYITKLRELTRKPAIKAFCIQSKEDVKAAENSCADYILLDSGKGSGKVFDWELLSEVKRPYFLAGGLDPENVGRAIERLSPFAVDVSSGIETEGVKDADKMTSFVKEARRQR